MAHDSRIKGASRGNPSSRTAHPAVKLSGGQIKPTSRLSDSGGPTQAVMVGPTQGVLTNGLCSGSENRPRLPPVDHLGGSGGGVTCEPRDLLDGYSRAGHQGDEGVTQFDVNSGQSERRLLKVRSVGKPGSSDPAAKLPGPGRIGRRCSYPHFHRPVCPQFHRS